MMFRFVACVGRNYIIGLAQTVRGLQNEQPPCRALDDWCYFFFHINGHCWSRNIRPTRYVRDHVLSFHYGLFDCSRRGENCWHVGRNRP